MLYRRKFDRWKLLFVLFDRAKYSRHLVQKFFSRFVRKFNLVLEHRPKKEEKLLSKESNRIVQFDVIYKSVYESTRMVGMRTLINQVIEIVWTSGIYEGHSYEKVISKCSICANNDPIPIIYQLYTLGRCCKFVRLPKLIVVRYDLGYMVDIYITLKSCNIIHQL